jgi:hypothetical protein
MNNLKIVWQYWGEKLAIGVYAASRDDAERLFNVCYNYGAVDIDSRIQYLKDDNKNCFGYFCSTWKDLTKLPKRFRYYFPYTQKQIDDSRENFLKNENEARTIS